MDKQLSNEDIVELMGLLQVCCALKTQTQMYLKEEEAAAILSHIICTCPPFSTAGVRFIEVTLCVMLACPFLISIDGCENAVVRWFQWLLEKLTDFDQACGSHCSYGELLLLVSIHLREKQLEQIEDLITNTLSMRVSSSLRSGHFSSLSRLFLKVFTEEVVCSHAVSVPPTSQLSAEVKGYLPVHCIHQLIRMRNFRKYNISIKDWIYKQLLVISEPLHPTLPPLMQEFVNSVLVSAITTTPRSSGYGSATGTTTSKNHLPFSAEEVLSVFERDPETYACKFPIPSQLLMLYYLLLYQDCFLTNLKPLLMHGAGGGSGRGQEVPRAYSPKVLTQIPMKYLLDHARRFQGRYATLYPTLLKLTAMQFPQLCLVCEWMTEKREIAACDDDALVKRLDIPCDGRQQVLKVSKKITPQSALSVLQRVNSSPSQVVLLLTHLSSLPPSSLVPYTPCVMSSLPLLLHSPSTSRVAQGLVLTLWTKLNTIIPRRLWLETVNALRPPQMLTMQPYSHQDIAMDPLIVLRCDPRALRCPSVFDLVLRCLAAYMSTAKTWLHEQSHLQACMATARPDSASSGSHMTKQERDEMCIALSATQESAIIQLMLEICLPNQDDRKLEASFGSQLTPLREIRCLVCSYLHHTFIDEPSLAKLVHFQGYPPELLPMMVAGIPSMHICLDFIPELLAQPRTERQIFGIQLAAHVIRQYPVPESMGIAKDIFQRLRVVSVEVSPKTREQYFLSVLPCVSLLCHTFPPLCSDATELLVHLTKLCKPEGGPLAPVLPTARDWGDTNTSTATTATVAGSGEISLIQAIKNTFSELVVFITA